MNTAHQINTPLNTFIQEDLRLAALFEKLGLDFCCGGQQTLAEACAAKGLDPEDVLRRIEQERARLPRDNAEAWSEAGPGELVDHLEATHHVYLKEALPRLDALLEKVVTAHGARHPELNEVNRCFKELRAELEPHLLKEERVLFPMIRQLEESVTAPSFHCGSILNPIRVMRMEHDRAGELLAELRKLTADYTVPDDGCLSYQSLMEGLRELEADTHIHIHKENNLLFPKVEELERASQM